MEKSIKERTALNKKLGQISEKLNALEKKLGVQERANARGESLYKEREEDIRVLKLEVKRLRHEEEVVYSSHVVTLKLNVDFRELKNEGQFHYKNFLRALK